MKHCAFTLVCQGALTISACVRHHAPLFDRYVVVEGAALEIPAGRGNGLRMTGGSPSSTDGTVDILRRLERQIPNLTVIYANGEPWPGKTAMCQAALEFCEPGWLWQIDADEFWWPEQVQFLQDLLEASDYTDVEVWMRHFWGTTEYHTELKNDAPWGNSLPWRRVFRWKGEPWASHEPPRLRRTELVLMRDETRSLGIVPMHLGYVHPSQFTARELFYGMKPGRLLDERQEWLKTSNPLSSPAGRLVEYKGDFPLDVSFLRC